MSRIGIRLSATFLVAGVLLSSCSAVEDAVGGAVSEVAADSAGAALDLLLAPACSAVLVPLDGYERLATIAAQNKDVQQVKALLNEYLAPMTSALSVARATLDSIESSKSATLLRELGVVDQAALDAQLASGSTDAQAVLDADSRLRSAIIAVRSTCETL